MNTFEGEINQSIKHLNSTLPNFLGWRLYDTAAFIGKSPYAPSQPADFITIHHGRACLLELKSQRKEPSFTHTTITSQQWESMSKMWHVGARSYFLLNRRTKPRHYQCYAIDPISLDYLIDEYGKKTTLRWNKIAEQSINIPREHQTWNLTPLYPDPPS